MLRLILPSLLVAVLDFTAHAAGEPPLARLRLFAPAELRQWSTAESRVAVAAADTGEAAGALHWSVVVDHTTGEPKYPIGWPRVNRSLPAGPQRDWSDWDYLECRVLVRTNRESLPSIPAGLGLHTPDRAGAYQRTLAELQAGAWVHVRIPIASIPRHHEVRQIQFHIAESNYRHGDRLDFYFRDLALVRHTMPTLLAFTAENTVAFTEASSVTLRLNVAGIDRGHAATLAGRLAQRDRVLARREFRVHRGLTTVPFPLGTGPFSEGDYDLSLQFGEGDVVYVLPFRLVDSPWKDLP